MREKVKITFQREGKTVEVAKGTSLLEAAAQAGVYIKSICGGDGICGACRLILKKGAVKVEPTTLLTRDEIKKGYVFACQTKAEGDVVIEIPPESREKKEKILVDKDARRFRALYAPLVGNTSVTGAKMALFSREALDVCYEISRKITYYDLITHPNYMDEFMSAKFLPHTDLDKFPRLVAGTAGTR